MNRFKHCSFDLETFGTSSNAVMVSLGISFFNLYEARVVSFPLYFDVDDCLSHGMSVDAGALRFWMGQPDEARDALYAASPYSLSEGLKVLNGYIDEFAHPKEFSAWSHATFDPPILCNAFKTVGLPCNIHYREFKDIRTLTSVYKKLCKNAEKHERPSEFVHHSALDDAIYQASYVKKMLLEIENKA